MNKDEAIDEVIGRYLKDISNKYEKKLLTPEYFNKQSMQIIDSPLSSAVPEGAISRMTSMFEGKLFNDFMVPFLVDLLDHTDDLKQSDGLEYLGRYFEGDPKVSKKVMPFLNSSNERLFFFAVVYFFQLDLKFNDELKYVEKLKELHQTTHSSYIKKTIESHGFLRLQTPTQN